MADRTVALDGLRGVAALMVFGHHVGLPGLERAALGFDAGVMIFFSLSGYLLYRPFVDGRIDLRAYAVRRVLRIMPAYLLAALLVSAIWHPASLMDMPGLLTMGQTPIVVVWTLVIEVGFYVTLPLFAWILARARRPELWIAWGAVLSLGVGIVELAVTRTSPLSFFSWAWAFAPGMLIAIPAVRERLAGVPLLALAIPLLSLSIVLDLGYPDLPAALGSGLLLRWVLTHPSLGGRASMVLGALSYSVYLWHVPIIDAVNRPASWAGSLIALAITVVIAAASYLLVEGPAIALGRRLGRWVARPTRLVGLDPRISTVEPPGGPAS